MALIAMPLVSTFLGGQVEQHGFDASIGQMGGDLPPITPAPSTAALRIAVAV